MKTAQIGKTGSCHLFRHTMATLMHESGADIRFIQQMLGHASLDTTEMYTQVSIRMLKQIHAATHPGAHLERRSPRPRPRARCGQGGTAGYTRRRSRAEDDANSYSSSFSCCFSC